MSPQTHPHARPITLIAAAVIVFLAAAPPPVCAQVNLERFDRQMEQIHRDTFLRADQSIPADRRSLVDYGGFLNLGYVTLDDRFRDNHVLRQYDLVGYTRLNLDGAQEFFLRGSIGYRDFHSGDSFDGRGDEPIDGDLDRGYYQFDLRRSREAYGGGGDPSFNLVFKAGRDLAVWGNGLVLSRVLDGLVMTSTWGNLEIGLVAGVTPVRTVDIDPSRPAFDHNTRRGFYGATVGYRQGAHHAFIYGLLQRDYNEHDEAVLAGAPTRYEYNSYYLGAGIDGAISDRWLYGLEVAYEGGNTRSNSIEVTPAGAAPIDQTRDAIQAWAADLRIDFLPGDAGQSRLSFEAIVASGDPDRQVTSSTFGGNRPDTNDHAFNAFGLLNTGLAFAPAVSNLVVVRIGASTFPIRAGEPWQRLQVGVDVLAFWKTRANAPIDEPTGPDHFLGWEPDLFLNWRLTSDLSLALRYGVFFPGSAILSGDDARQFFYMGVTYAF